MSAVRQACVVLSAGHRRGRVALDVCLSLTGHVSVFLEMSDVKVLSLYRC